MKVARFNPGLQAMAFGGLTILLAIASALLYRSIGRASEADRMQQQAQLEAAMRGCAGEFGGAVQEVLASFRPAPRMQAEAALEPYVAELYAQWQGTARQPRIVGALGLGTVDAKGKPDFRRFRPGGGKFERAEWPASLASLQQAIAARGASRVAPAGFALVLADDRPVLVLPLLTITLGSPGGPGRATAGGGQNGRPAAFGPPWERFGGERGSAPFGKGPPPWVTAGQAPPWLAARRALAGRGGTPRLQLAGWCFVELDPAYLKSEFLAALIHRHFRGGELAAYEVVAETGADGEADAAEPLVAPANRLGDSFGTRLPISGGWRLVARHRAGSLAAVIERERRRGLLLGGCLLVLIFGSVALLVATAHRARVLAKRQMEFVAGVSHELRTPLSVIQAAGFNLAQGRVADADRVQLYGETIQTEGRRLADMVEQILGFAGIQSGRRRYEFQPVRIEEVIDGALREYRASFDEAGWRIEREIETGLPPVRGDIRALESAVRNLLGNALKYAAGGKWLRFSARRERDEVQLTIADRGPGIDPADLRAIFEPFYRGRGVLASSIPGAGLGLSILHHHIRAHGGSVTIDTAPGAGAAFTLHLPVLSDSDHDKTS